MTHFILVHSPLVGVATWDAVAGEARRRGHTVVVPDLMGTLDGSDSGHVARQVAVVAQSVGARPAVVVGHSGAGPLISAAGHVSQSPVRAYVYVDARLPTPGRSWFDTAPAELAAQLRGMAHDGWLPPWSQWWDPKELTELLPDPTVRERFVAGCPRLPFGMFQEARPPSPVRWAAQPSAYLRLSDGYQEPADEARGYGWPVVELPAHHLAMLTEPDRVLDSLLDLEAQVQQQPRLAK